jgi:hypothetical protein
VLLKTAGLSDHVKALVRELFVDQRHGFGWVLTIDSRSMQGDADPPARGLTLNPEAGAKWFGIAVAKSSPSHQQKAPEVRFEELHSLFREAALGYYGVHRSQFSNSLRAGME